MSVSLQRSYLLILLVGILFCTQSRAQPEGSVFPLPGLAGPRAVLLDNPWNVQFLQDSMHTYRLKESTEEWILVRRQLNQYNSQGQPVESVHYKNAGYGWIPVQKEKFEYNEDRVLIRKQTEIYPPSLNTWVADSCFRYSYNSPGLLDSIIVSRCRSSQPLVEFSFSYSHLDELEVKKVRTWNTEHQMWRNTHRTLYTWNSLSNPLTEIEQSWKEAVQDWNNHEMTSYIYNISGENLEQFTQQVWDEINVQWEDREIVELEYNQVGQVVHYNRFPAATDSGQTQVEAPVSINYTYTTDGNPVQVLVGEYNSSQNTWNYTENNEYFWSKHQVGTIQEREQDLCFFANPYRPGDILRCPNLKREIDYTLSILDMQGRTLHRQQITNEVAFRIESPVTPGLYVILISGGPDSYARKVIFANK